MSVVHVKMVRAWCPVCEADVDAAQDTRNPLVERCCRCGQDVWRPREKKPACTEVAEATGWDERPEWSETTFVFDVVVSVEPVQVETKRFRSSKKAARRALKRRARRAGESS